MVTCQSSELDWEVTVELPTDFLSLGRGSVKANITTMPHAPEFSYALGGVSSSNPGDSLPYCNKILS